MLWPPHRMEDMPRQASSLDLVLMVMEGMEDVSPLQGQRIPHLPLIALISRPVLGAIHRLKGFDDFVIAPWDVDEIIARAQYRVGQQGREIIRCRDLVINPDTYEVNVDGREVSLTFREYQLLYLLAKDRGRVFTRDALLNEVWGYDYFGGDRAVDVYIRRIRSKIEDGNHEFIQTVRNVGYRFRKED